MYLRSTQRRNRDGSVVRYLQLAHNDRVDGTTQAKVLLNLGREDGLDRDGLTRLVASINRYLGEPAASPGAAELVGDALTVTGSRPMGTAYLLSSFGTADRKGANPFDGASGVSGIPVFDPTVTDWRGDVDTKATYANLVDNLESWVAQAKVRAW